MVSIKRTETLGETSTFMWINTIFGADSSSYSVQHTRNASFQPGHECTTIAAGLSKLNVYQLMAVAVRGLRRFGMFGICLLHW